nr:hypothetical protein [Tanacetum cinerariifolium]
YLKSSLCIHDDVDDLIESVLNSKFLLINSNSKRLDKKEQEVKNVIEQPAKRGNRSIQSLQNFRVVHKSSISFKNTSQISSIHAVAPVLSTKEHKHLLSMRYEHLSITPEMESDEVTESNAENLLPIPSKCEDTVGFEFDQNQKNQFERLSVDTKKFHGIPHSYHNKENLVTHVKNNYHHSSDCNLVPVHRQTETVVDNHNHHVNCFHINCTSDSRIKVVKSN